MALSSSCLRRLTVAVALWISGLQVLPGTLAHIALWNKGMYCFNGTIPAVDNQNANEAVNPLYKLKRSDWWMHHVNGCDEFPPAPGDFLELPAGKSVVVELAMNRAFTSLSYDGRLTAIYGDGEDHPGLGSTNEGKSSEGCIITPNIHTKNEQEATGTALAISYQSNIRDVTPENLVVFSVLYNTPWKRIAEYQIPNLPACPPGGCHCVWGWVPDGCGELNMYMQPLRCKVVGRTGTRVLAPAVPPVYCEGNQSACVRGAKQMIFYNQLEGNNINATARRHPAYNMKLGFVNGAQTDIFLGHNTATSTYIRRSPTTTPRAADRRWRGSRADED